MQRSNEDKVSKCAFCGKSKEQVEHLVGGQRPGVFICNNCVALCCELLREEKMINLEQNARAAYFQKAGDANTDETIKLAAERAIQLGIRDIVVASSTGATAIKVAEVFKKEFNPMRRHPVPEKFNIIAVTLHAGIWKKYAAPDPVKVKQAEEMGVKFLTCTHSLMGNVGTAIMEKFGGINLTDLIAHTYYTFSQGTKVAVEIVVMAADAGLIRVDREVISIAGTDSGADTALVIKPAYCTDFFSLRVREIIAKPR